MDRALIEQKVESLRQCTQRIHDKCPPLAEDLARDIDAQDIIAVNLTRAVQLCVDIAAHWIAASGLPAPQTMGEAFARLADAGVLDAGLAQRLRGAVGFRNVAVHSYRAIDWQIVHRIVHRHLDDFGSFALEAMRHAQ